MADISTFLTAKDVQTISNLQILARQVVEASVPVCTARL